MKRKIAKLAALLLVMALLLAGCGDPVKEIEKETAALKEEYAGVVTAYDGGEVTIGEAMLDFRYMYDQLCSYAEYYGYELTGEDIQSMMTDTLEEHVRREVAAQRFDAEHALTQEELEEVQASAEAQYAGLYEIAVSNAEGKSDAEKEARAQLLLVRSCLDYDSVYSALLLEKKAARMEEILGGEIGEIGEEELLAAYETRVLEDEAAYEEGSAYLELDMAAGDSAVCWIPDGYRRVKHILLIPAEEVLETYAAARTALEEGEAALLALEEEKKDAEDDDSEEGPARSVEELAGLIADAEAEIASLEAALEEAGAACIADVKETSDEIYARLAAGEDFSALIEAFGQDPAMLAEPSVHTGYYVSAESILWDPAFRDAAMSLANPGDYTLEPVASINGVHIVCYEDDAQSGAVPLEQVREELEEELLADARSAHAEEIIAAWVDEANASYDVQKFAEAFVEE